MRIERKKNAERNVVWGVIERISILLFPFINRTIMIYIMGAEYVGVSSLFTSILTVLSVSELGMGSAITFSMYKPIAEDDNDTICALLNLYRKLYYTIGTIILVVGLCLSPFLPNLISGDIPHDLNLYVLYYLYLANTVISYYLFAYKVSLFSAYQREDIVSKRTMTVSIGANILQIIILVLWKNYYGYVLCTLLATVATNFLNAYVAAKLYPQHVCKGNVSSEQKNDIKKRVKGLMSYKIRDVFFDSADSIVISAFLGLVKLAQYNNYYLIQGAIRGFMDVFNKSIKAGVGNKLITNSIDDNYKDFKNIVFINGWVTSWCAVCLLCLYQPFMVLWVGKEHLLPIETAVLMVIQFFLPRLQIMVYVYREAAGLWWEDRYRPLISGALNLLFDLILVRYFGINGIVIASILCNLLVVVPWATKILFKNCFHCSTKEYFLKFTYYCVVTAIAGIITYLLCGILPSTEIGALLIKIVICMIIPNLVFLLFYNKMDEFGYMKNLIKDYLIKIV